MVICIHAGCSKQSKGSALELASQRQGAWWKDGWDRRSGDLSSNKTIGHQAVSRPMLNFKSFRCAGRVLAGVELMHMIREGQFAIDGVDAMSIAD